MDEDLEKLVVAAGVVAAWFLASRYLAELITENYYLVETISLLLIFGLLYEIYTSSSGDEDFVDLMVFIGSEFNRTGAQLALLFGVSSLVVTSMMFRDWVEAQFGPLAVVQLLAFVAIISRAFVNVRATGDPLAVLDGQRDTYLIYLVGLLAIVFSFILRDAYSPYSTMHNAAVIFLSTIIPATYLYVLADDKDLPSLKALVDSRT